MQHSLKTETLLVRSVKKTVILLVRSVGGDWDTWGDVSGQWKWSFANDTKLDEDVDNAVITPYQEAQIIITWHNEITNVLINNTHLLKMKFFFILNDFINLYVYLYFVYFLVPFLPSFFPFCLFSFYLYRRNCLFLSSLLPQVKLPNTFLFLMLLFCAIIFSFAGSHPTSFSSLIYSLYFWLLPFFKL